MSRRRFHSQAWRLLLLFGFFSGAGVLSQTVDIFNPNVGDIDYAVALQSDGAILIGGKFTNVANTVRQHLARLASDGTVQSSMNVGLDGDVYAIAVQDDGRILVGGNFSAFKATNGSTVTSSPLVRFLPDGSRDPTFKGSASGIVFGIIVQRDQKILVRGLFSTLSGIGTSMGLGRLEADGSADTNFIHNVFGGGTAQCLGMQSDGKILVGGNFMQLGGQPCTNLGRLNVDGTLDNSFRSEYPGPPYCLAVQPDGKVLVHGQGPPPGLYTSFLRLNADGTKDTNFVSQRVQSGPVDGGTVRSIAIQADGSIIIGGGFITIGTFYRTNVARLGPNGAVDTWRSPTEEIYSLAIQDDGHPLLAGNFWYVGAQMRHYVARLGNVEPATNDLKISRSEITWSHGGSSPAFWAVGLASSLNGVDWTPLGDAHIVPGGWNLSGLELTPGSFIRARGRVLGGYLNGSSWYLEKTAMVPEWPRIVSNDSRFGIDSQLFGFNISGASGQQFVIERSDDLLDWIPITTNTLGTADFYFSTPLLPAPAARFFRLR